ncbi:sodium:alanine symporter family protein [Lysinibacillus sp. 2017]|uniref:alanine/glycine:cation symporter family protein n=1 Tax=unclassified Lysinibacillus TaxID=2636778 RepID=UPI000D5283EB|nr:MULTISPECIES: alanine/glycine:cation symporter family protein [unclassified Lysinibacillus]AWE07600.1 sodium:alanine symporter family protein [Lysinibacillus sp. 2017]TGN36763.1 alanine:cation symporter family protein [Lysinibacillus sp. S2017]
MTYIENIVSNINNFMYSYLLIYMLIGIGLFFTIRTKFVQFRMIPEMFRVIKEKAPVNAKGVKGISSFQAFTISAASRIGTGNVAGVATAIALGGPGAIFWMWCIALIGGASSFIESTLAQVYKTPKGDGTFRGGPAYYIEKGLKKRWMGITFAIAITLCFGFVFNAVQANTISIAFNESFGVSRTLMGAILAILTAVIIFGGLRRIVSVTTYLVPIMAIGYIILALIVVVVNITEVPTVIGLIVKSAFGADEMFAGMVGAAVLNGIKRGLFSNEAGMGSVPNAAATADVTHPAKQGLIQTLGVFIDTMLICTATAMIVLMSDAYLSADAASINLTQVSLSDSIGSWAGAVLAITIFFFAFSSVIGNYYYGESNIEFIKRSPLMINIFRILVVGFVFFGAVAKVQLVWDLADVFMGIMAFINLIAILMLWKVAKKVLDNYIKQRKAGKDPTFYADEIDGLDNTECWERDRHQK